MQSINSSFKPNNDKLKKNYNEALKDDIFKQFISKLNGPEELLQKYTSLLIESKNEYNNCLNCKSLSNCKNKVIGYMYTPKISSVINFVYKPCRFKKNIDSTNKHLKNISFYSLPTSLKQASFDQIDASLISRKTTLLWLNKFLRDYPNVNKGLYLNGSFGSGKTYLIVATLNELAKKNIKSAVIFWPEFLRDIKNSFSTDYGDRIEYIKNVPILLIDDLGAETTTSWARDEILCNILQHRMDEKLTTFITSNLNLEQMCNHLSSSKDGVEIVKANRIIERIKQLTENIEMISKNMRG